MSLLLGSAALAFAADEAGMEEAGVFESLGNAVDGLFTSKETEYRAERKKQERTDFERQLQREAEQRDEIRRRFGDVQRKEHQLQERERNFQKSMQKPSAKQELKQVEEPVATRDEVLEAAPTEQSPRLEDTETKSEVLENYEGSITAE